VSAVVVVSVLTCSVDVEEGGVPRINLCLSSPSFSSSLSEPSAPKVSARFWSTGISWCREVGDEARDRKDGGGELGVWGVIGDSSSFGDTWR
jgi:hypothetical protein